MDPICWKLSKFNLSPKPMLMVLKIFVEIKLSFLDPYGLVACDQNQMHIGSQVAFSKQKLFLQFLHSYC